MQGCLKGSWAEGRDPAGALGSPQSSSPKDETEAGRPGVPGQQKGALVGSKVRKSQTTPVSLIAKAEQAGVSEESPSFMAGLGAAGPEEDS